MKESSIHQILLIAFNRKKALRPEYSQGTLARDLGVSGAFVSKMLKGAKLPPLKKFSLICKVFELDVHERKSLSQALISLHSSDALLPESISEIQTPKNINRETLPLTKDDIIDKWYNIAVLEGLSLKEPFNNSESLKSRLGISTYQWDSAIEKLQNLGVVEERHGRLTKIADHAYMPTGRSRQQVRRFHKQMIKKGLDELEKTDDDSFHRRLITGFTFAVNPDHLERLKAKLIEVLDEFTKEASQGECTEVYQINTQLFPLTQAHKK